MAFNPFLSMNEPAAPATPEALNPFMMADVEPMAVTGDNPFAASNPFSDFGAGIEPPAGDTVPVDIFGSVETANIDAKLFDAYTGEAPPAIDIFSTPSIEQERVIKPTELDLVSTTTGTNFISEDAFTSQQPPRPLPPETQNLILSVTGQMDITSSHLLDRIPPTRTPSPVSIRDIHSPSPTPEPEFEEDEKVQEPIAPVPSETLDINRNKPTRPPPARPPPATRAPPPRPAPPPPPPKQRPPPSQPQAVHQEPAADDINLFDAPAKVTVKPTMEAIMSLYTAPKKEEKPIDFLSDDLLEDIPATEDLHAIKKETSEFVPEDVHVSPVAAKTESEVSTGLFAMDTSAVEPVSQMDCSEPPNEVTSMNTSPFTDMATNNFEDYVPSSGEKNPFEISEDTSTTYLDNNAPNIFNVKSEDIVMESTDSHAVIAQTDNFESQIDNVFTTTSSVPFTAAPSEVFSTANSEPFAAVQDEAFSTAPSNVFSAAPTDAFASASNDAFNSDGFGLESGNFENSTSIPATDSGWGTSEAMAHDAFPESQDAFDAFSAKFDSTLVNHVNTGAWGDDGGTDNAPAGFEAEAFDPFLSMGAPPPPAATPRLDHQGSRDSADESFNLFIRPKESETSGEETAVPVLAPPPRPQALAESPRLFEDSDQPKPQRDAYPRQDERSRSGSGGETPPTPLFDEDVSVPLEEFPRVKYDGPGWEMHLRQPNKKKITGQRFWKKVFVRIAYQGDNPVVQLRNASTDKEPFQELPLQACYSVSDVGAQQFDQFGKIFTVKLQYVFYKERPGVRPGQVTKAERITNKLSQFAAYAIQGDYQGVKEFGSDLRKLGLPVEHAPQVSQLFKLGSLSYEDVKQFSACIEEALFRLPAHRDRALSYKMEEMQITAVDELYVEQDAEGSVQKQIARVRLFFLGFLTGMPDIELGVNDLRRQGREVVGRHDIIPVITEEWIRVEDTEFHACVQPHEFYNTQLIKFKPPDACYIELMRFRIRPPKNRELPLQLKAQWCVNGNKVELRADVLVPGFASRKLGQVPCEDVAIRFPIPEAWIYLFRVEKHFRYGSVKSAHRRTGKIKGIERFLGAVDNLQESLIEVTSGQAKYEHQHRAIVWRMPRLPKEGQGAYTTHNLVCRMALTSFDQIPAQLATHALVEFTMPATQVSHVTVRSAALQPPPDEPPEKYVRYLARHEYIVGIERTSGQSAPAYAVAAAVEHAPAPPAPTAPLAAPQPPSSDSDSD